MISSPSLPPIITECTLPSTMHQLISRINPVSVYSFFPSFLFKRAGLNVLIASVIFYVQDRI